MACARHLSPISTLCYFSGLNTGVLYPLHFQICASYCSTVPNALFAGVEGGTDCYCEAASEDVGKNGALEDEGCATLCFADPGSTCGGVDAIEVRVSWVTENARNEARREMRS